MMAQLRMAVAVVVAMLVALPVLAVALGLGDVAALPVMAVALGLEVVAALPVVAVALGLEVVVTAKERCKKHATCRIKHAMRGRSYLLLSTALFLIAFFFIVW